MNTNELLRRKRKELNLTMKQVADYVGVSEATVSRWESGNIANMGRDKIALLSQILKITPGVIAGYDDFYPNGTMPIPKMVKKPRLGVISCGEPILTEENFDRYDNVPENIDCDFTLQCKGDSMINARINDGDIVYIKSQSMVDNGQIAAVMVDNETTLKRVFVYQNKIVLQAENPKYEPWVYVNEELNSIRILGKAVGFFSYL